MKNRNLIPQTVIKLGSSVNSVRSINYWKTLEENFRKVHNTEYDYSEAIFTASRDKIKIKCKTCSNSFLMDVSSHLRGQGCPKCSIEKRASKRRKPLSTFIEEATKIHKGTYLYLNSVYRNNNTKLKVTCKLHGDFEVTPDNHLFNRSGCPYCREIKRQILASTNPTCLYYMKITGKTKTPIYKIGITSRPLAYRFVNEGFKEHFEVLFQTEYGDREQMVRLEQRILQKFINSLLLPEVPILIPKNGGDTELFKQDIFKEQYKSFCDNASIEDIEETLNKLRK